MKKLKCESCGSNLKIDGEYAICEYCGMKYKLNEEFNINLKLDDSLKQTFKTAQKTNKVIFTIILLIFITIFIIIIVNIIDMKTKDYKTQDNEYLDNYDQFEKHSFNSKFELYSGTKATIFVNSIIDNAITNNKTNSNHKVYVIYKDTNTCDSEELINIKHSLKEYSQYEVKLDYDDNGYVYQIKIEDIEK